MNIRFSRAFCTLNLMIGGVLLNSCSSSKPKHYAETANASDAISATQANLDAAVNNQVDAFAPHSFKLANNALVTARAKRADNASNDAILVEVEKADQYLNQANKKANITEAALAGVLDARKAALESGANVSLKKDFRSADRELVSFSKDAEEGSLDKPEKTASDLVKQYHDLEMNGVIQAKLGRSQALIKTAENENAKKDAPKSWKLATEQCAAAVALIKKDPHNTPAIDEAARHTQFEAEKLLRVTRATKAAGGKKSEDVVLQNETQQDYISAQGQQLEKVSNEKDQAQDRAASLQPVKDLEDKVQTISQKFTPSEAEVYQQGQKVIVRLKGIKFPKDKATIPTASFDTLKKVEEAIEAFDHPKVLIEGHTDATGSNQINLPLSKQRAQAVKTYLTANLSLPKDEVETEGFGSSRPITTNKTAAGRAQNRRIDVVISE